MAAVMPRKEADAVRAAMRHAVESVGVPAEPMDGQNGAFMPSVPAFKAFLGILRGAGVVPPVAVAAGVIPLAILALDSCDLGRKKVLVASLRVVPSKLGLSSYGCLTLAVSWIGEGVKKDQFKLAQFCAYLGCPLLYNWRAGNV